jgi:prephenate dehydrogenase
LKNKDHESALNLSRADCEISARLISFGHGEEFPRRREGTSQSGAIRHALPTETLTRLAHFVRNDSLGLHCYNDTVLVAIIGLGLIGGSIGLALRQGKRSRWGIVGYSRRQETVATALSLGAIQRGATNIKDAVRQVDLVIIATPVLAVKETFSQIAPDLPSGCIVTDTASTKVQVMKWAEEILPPTVNFIGGHPMAGKETYGIQAAEAELFQRCTYCVTPSDKASPKSIDTVIDMVKKLGAIPSFLDAQEHDNLVAGISHLPMLLSAALVSLTTKNPSWAKMSKLAASGYHDLTRLASGSPEVNSQICLSNHEAIIDWIDRFSRELDRYRQLVAKGDKRLEQALTEANRARQEWLEQTR